MAHIENSKIQVLINFLFIASFLLIFIKFNAVFCCRLLCSRVGNWKVDWCGAFSVLGYLKKVNNTSSFVTNEFVGFVPRLDFWAFDSQNLTITIRIQNIRALTSQMIRFVSFYIFLRRENSAFLFIIRNTDDYDEEIFTSHMYMYECKLITWVIVMYAKQRVCCSQIGYGLHKSCCECVVEIHLRLLIYIRIWLQMPSR